MPSFLLRQGAKVLGIRSERGLTRKSKGPLTRGIDSALPAPEADGVSIRSSFLEVDSPQSRPLVKAQFSGRLVSSSRLVDHFRQAKRVPEPPAVGPRRSPAVCARSSDLSTSPYFHCKVVALRVTSRDVVGSALPVRSPCSREAVRTVSSSPSSSIATCRLVRRLFAPLHRP